MFKNIALKALFIGVAVSSFSLNTNAQSSLGEELCIAMTSNRGDAVDQNVKLPEGGKDAAKVLTKEQKKDKADDKSNNEAPKNEAPKNEDASVKEPATDSDASSGSVANLSDSNRGHTVLSYASGIVTGALAVAAWYNRASFSGLANKVLSFGKAACRKFNVALEKVADKLSLTRSVKKN